MDEINVHKLDKALVVLINEAKFYKAICNLPKLTYFNIMGRLPSLMALARVSSGRFSENECRLLADMIYDHYKEEFAPEYLLDEANQHIEKAEEHFDITNKILLESKMSNTPFKSVDYVYGKATTDMSDQDFLSAIQKVESEIAHLKTIKTKSVKISSKIAALTAELDTIVKAFDATETSK